MGSKPSQRPALFKTSVGETLKHADSVAVGLEIGLAIVVGYLLGTWFDGEFATEPFGLVIFGICGIGAAAKAIVRVAKKAKRELAVKEAPEDLLSSLAREER